jgi:CDP-glucose 4,6-dehydratase
MSQGLALYRGLRVLVFGHTGFAGSWLTLWLTGLGARVHGFALAPDETPNLFDALGVGRAIEHQVADIRDLALVADAVGRIRPDVVFHLAAQARVRRSYREPVDTFAVNVMGTTHVLEAIRRAGGPPACVVVTSDKCYENQEREQGYRETDRLGGDDAYSASKACAELVVAAYRSAFLARAAPAMLVASARAGNIIGGGDWTEDRIVPDCARAIAAGQRVTLRSPGAVRPWQHVLDALHGYLRLGARLLEGDASFAEAWNFGPDGAPRTVGEVAERFTRRWRPELSPEIRRSAADPPETVLLRLDPGKAAARLGWRARLGFEDAVDWSADWYRAFYAEPRSAPAVTAEQIRRFEDGL